ncbi:MAG: lysostaphin resistance A-like protein [Sandaracinaceae bacterium]
MSQNRSEPTPPAPKKPARAKAEAKPVEKGFRGWLKRRHDPLTSLLLTVPVFLIYHLGLLLPSVRMQNGVDFVTGLAMMVLRESIWGYIGLTLGYCVVIGIAVAVLRKKGKLRAAEFMPMLGESAILAVLMSFSLGWATEKLFSWQAGPEPMTISEKLVMSAGAGFHEELIFRVVLFAGGAWLLTKVSKLSSKQAVLVAAVVSSLLFSAVHYVGSLGDTLTIASFGFRFLGGLYLAAVYRFRGFAVAVYTHAIYDVLVFFFFQ